MRGDPIVSINGKQFEVCNPDDPYWKWVKDGHYRHEWEIYDAYLKPEHTFIDLGAWIGSHSLYASTITDKIFAVEPDPVAFEILKQNFSGKTLNQAVGSDGEVVLGSAWLGASTTRKNLAEGNHIGAADQTFTAQGVTLRKLVADCPDPLFIKMDIEGMEEEVFKDWQFFHERKPTLMVECHPWWWENEAETRKDFKKVADVYGVFREVHSGLFFLEK